MGWAVTVFISRRVLQSLQLGSRALTAYRAMPNRTLRAERARGMSCREAGWKSGASEETNPCATVA